jgi:hypothetical protein
LPVGSSTWFEAEDSGELFLGINADAASGRYRDNSGNLSVCIQVTGPPPPQDE